MYVLLPGFCLSQAKGMNIFVTVCHDGRVILSAPYNQQIQNRKWNKRDKEGSKKRQVDYMGTNYVWNYMWGLMEVAGKVSGRLHKRTPQWPTEAQGQRQAHIHTDNWH